MHLCLCADPWLNVVCVDLLLLSGFFGLQPFTMTFSRRCSKLVCSSFVATRGLFQSSISGSSCLGLPESCGASALVCLVAVGLFACPVSHWAPRSFMFGSAFGVLALRVGRARVDFQIFP